jgi:putative ABC transport system permease protein
MRFSDLLRGALVEIRAHKVRSALTCVSLAVGVAAALYTLSQVASIRRRYEDARVLSGPGRLEVRRKWDQDRRGLSKGLTLDDARAIRTLFPGLYMVSPQDNTWGPFAAEGFHNNGVSVMGVTPEWRLRDWVYRMEGRFFSPRDLETEARVCIIVLPGGWIKRPYWDKDTYIDPFDAFITHHDLLGHWVALNDHPFRVIGVLHEPPRDKDPRWFHNGGVPSILLPLTTAETVLRHDSQKMDLMVNEIQIDTGDEATAASYARRIEKALSERHRGEKDFEVKDYREFLEGAIKKMRSFIISIGIIGVIAMLAGGIGILNVTLATVFSRVREIGVRRALGATRRDIVAQFIVEALVLGVFSGAAGSALGALMVLKFSPSDRMIDNFSPVYALVSTAIAVGVSFAFSVGPAWQASRLDPMNALRYE